MLALLLAAALTGVATSPVGAALPDAEARMLGHLNSARSSQGLGSLTTHDTLTRVARGWAAQMASDYEANGSRQGSLRHNPSMASQLPSSYRRAGENVGYSVLTGASEHKLVDRLHEAYMGSAGHRANILGEYDRVGVGLVVADDGTMWSAVVFMLEGAPKPEPKPEPKPTEETATRSGPTSASGGASRDSAADSGSGSGQGDGPARAPEPAPAPPPPEPPTSAELFGPDWPEGYLTGDAEAAKRLLAGVHDLRAVVSLLPGQRSAGGTRLLTMPVDRR